jgi:tetratricopeptide (TPR) repeat protein
MESNLPDDGASVESFSRSETAVNGFSADNQETLERMVTILDFAEGFTLLFARCNLPVLRRQLIDVAQARLATLGIEVIEIECNGPVKNLRQLLRERLSAETPTRQPVTANGAPILQLQESTPAYAAPKLVLFVTGLEQSIPYDDPAAPLLAELNLGRELFQRELPHPLLFWLPDYALTAVARYAPDFWAWRSGVFEFASENTLRSQTTAQFTREGGWSAVSNLSPEAKLRRLRLLESLFDDYKNLPDNAAVQAELANIAFSLGEIHHILYDFAQAIRYYEWALSLHRQMGEKAREAATLNNIGGVYEDLGDKQQALAYYEQALSLWRQVGNRAGEAGTLNNIGRIYDDLGDKQQALAYYEQALLLRRQVGYKEGESTTLSNIGKVYDDLGDKQQALAYYEQALLLAQQVGDKTGEATTLNNIGRVYSDLGNKQQALTYFEQALSLQRQVGNKGSEATILSNIGMVYSDLGDKQQALTYLEQALLLAQQVGDKAGEAVTLNNIGVVYGDLDDRRQALAYFEQALPLRRQVGDKDGEATTLSNIGKVYDDLGDKQQALF